MSVSDQIKLFGVSLVVMTLMILGFFLSSVTEHEPTLLEKADQWAREM